ncbi:MAG: threonine-phosphate decarboxylase CobD [Candidatus Omnitrophota bacterium]
MASITGGSNLNFLHGGNIHKAERDGRKKVLDFSANINPLGIPSVVKEKVYKNFDKVLHYPDPEAEDVTGKIAEYLGIEKKNILIGNGSVEFIYLLMNVYRPRTVLIPVPVFSEYERAARNAGSKVYFLRLKEKHNFKMSPVRPREADIIFAANPNNPTGNFIAENFKEIEKAAGRLIIVDEAFMDFVEKQKKYSLVQKAVKNKKIIVLRTLTKFFAMPGLRIGYVVAHENIIRKLKAYQTPWSVNSLAQLAAEKVLDDRDYIRKTHELIQKERTFLYGALGKIAGIKTYPSVVNFILIKIERKDITSKVLRECLMKKGILIRDCGNFRGLSDKYIRVAIRSRKENLKLISALRKVMI